MRYLPLFSKFAGILVLVGLLVAPPAVAAVVDFDFNADLQTGTLAGTMFPGTGSYDNAGVTGVGEEFVALSSLQFSLNGVEFTKADIKQGGQAILEGGVLSYFTAAFFPPPPDNSPVSDIAFGFGGPGIIGYIASSGVFGDGVYTITSISVPEPAPAAVFGLAFLVSTFSAFCLPGQHPRARTSRAGRGRCRRLGGDAGAAQGKQARRHCGNDSEQAGAQKDVRRRDLQR
jgi:hypothetical protein